MARKQRKAAARSGALRTKESAAQYSARVDDRDEDLVAQIDALVSEGARMREEIEDRIEARLQGRRA